MIYGNINESENYTFFNEQLRECIEYVKSHDMAAMQKGRCDIDGERLYANIAEYVTVDADDRFWEAHRAYLDVHVILRGNERIDLNFIPNMDVKTYVEEEDFLPMEGGKAASVILHEGDFLVCFPGDAHKTGVAAEESETIKKAIFKVRI